MALFQHKYYVLKTAAELWGESELMTKMNDMLKMSESEAVLCRISNRLIEQRAQLSVARFITLTVSEYNFFIWASWFNLNSSSKVQFSRIARLMPPCAQ